MTRPRPDHPRPDRRKRAAPQHAKGGRRSASGPSGRLLLHGLHTVRAALANPIRRSHTLHVTANARARLEAEPDGAPLPDTIAVRDVDTETLTRLVGRDAVHQGVVLECDPLERIDASELHRLADERLVLVLDQVTDPHNVGAILRSAVALGAGAVLVTARNAPQETGVLAKSASGALDHIAMGELRNLRKALGELAELGFLTVGLDSEGGANLSSSLPERPGRIALVLGAEGRGLREGTREACSILARLDMPGPIKSLNVSNAAALALYVARTALERG